MTSKKDARMHIRLSKEDKTKFYKLCDQHGLCPSQIIERWIHRFILNGKGKPVRFGGIIGTPHDEVYMEYADYMSSEKTNK